MISVTLGLLFLCRPIRSKDRIQLEWILRLRSLACLGFWWGLLNTLCNVNFTTITRFPATSNATTTTGWQQHATASWEATTGNTSVSAGYHTRIRCNAKKNNKKNKWSNDEVLIKKFYAFVQYQTQLHECIFSGKMFSYPVPHIKFIYESHHGKNSYRF